MIREVYSLLKNQSVAQYFYQVLYTPSQRRHVIQWLKTLNSEYMLKKGIPWIAFDAIDFLKANLLRNIRVFEYGSGSSTIFWQKFNAHCISIEHDPNWFYKVNRYLQVLPYNIDHRLVLPESRKLNNVVTEAEAAIPELYLSADKEFYNYSFQNYVSQIDLFPNSYFDVVLIDGRARPSCLVHSAHKVKIGGYLILDNADRNYYLENTRHTLKNFKSYSFCGVTPALKWITRTDVFVRQR